MAVIADAGEAAFEVARPRAAHMQPGDARRHQIGRRGIFDDAVAARDPDFGNPYIADRFVDHEQAVADRSEEHTSELQSPMRNSYADLCLKQNTQHQAALYVPFTHN